MNTMIEGHELDELKLLKALMGRGSEGWTANETEFVREMLLPLVKTHELHISTCPPMKQSVAMDHELLMDTSAAVRKLSEELFRQSNELGNFRLRIMALEHPVSDGGS